MTLQEFHSLPIRESNTVEGKAMGDPEQIVPTLAALAYDYEGSGGGRVLCGVQEQTEPEGQTAAIPAGLTPEESR
ncbi:MAG: hypothetical protein JNL98_13385 [Bryobacterales bacterium]|nr:hypothetical protein [Bryobacterales bacterium]